MPANQRKRIRTTNREFELGSGELVSEMRKSGGKIVLTRKGRATGVALDMKSYRQIMDQVRQLEDIQAIQRGLEAADRGQKRPWDEAAADIRGKLGLSRRGHAAGRG